MRLRRSVVAQCSFSGSDCLFHALAQTDEHPIGRHQPEPADPLGVLTADRDLVAPHMDLGIEGLLYQPQQRIALAEQSDHEVVAGNEDLDLSGRHGGSR